MKISFFMPFVAISIISIFSCSMPESITVKSSGAKYEFPLGKGDVLLKEKMSASKMQDAISGDEDDSDSSKSNIEVYQYEKTEDENELLQYIINYPITDVPLSLTDSDTDLNAIEMDTKINLPDFNEKISNKLSLSDTDFSVNEGISGSVSLPPITINITSPTYEEIEIYDGMMEVSVVRDFSESVSYSMNTSITIIDKNGRAYPSNSSQDVANGGTLYIPLQGAVLANSFKVEINSYFSNVSGNPSDIHKYVLKMKPTNIKLSKITGLTMTKDDLGDDATVNIDETVPMTGLNECLVSAEIEKGSVNLKCPLPNGWENVSCATNISVTGGLTLSESEFSDLGDATYLIGKSASLDDKLITKDDMKLSGTATLEFNNATLVFENGQMIDSLDAKSVLSIEKLKSLKLDIKDLVNIEDTIDSGLNMQDMMSSFISEKHKDLIDNVEFVSLNAYVSATQPKTDVFENLKFAGKIKAVYEKDNIKREEYLIGSESENVTIEMTNLPKLSELVEKPQNDEDDNRIIKGNGKNIFEGYTSVDSAAITNIINSKPESLSFDYKFALDSGNSSVELTGDDLDALNNGESIGLNLIIVLPMQIRLKDVSDGTDDGKITIENVFDLIEDDDEAGNDDEVDDLLNRDDASETEKWSKYADLIKSITLTYTINNSTGLDVVATLIDDNCHINKPLEFTSGQTLTLELTREEIKNVCENYPFNPAIKTEILIPENDGLVQVKRNSEFGVKAKIKLVTDGELEIWNKDDGFIFSGEEDDDGDE